MVSTGNIKYGYLIISIILFSSCIKEAYNITCKGVVLDEETMLPIPNSSVHSHCVFQQNIDESSTVSLQVKTDSTGSFLIHFKKGYKISMVFEANNYMRNNIQLYPRVEEIPDTIYLRKIIQLESSVALPDSISFSE